MQSLRRAAQLSPTQPSRPQKVSLLLCEASSMNQQRHFAFHLRQLVKPHSTYPRLFSDMPRRVLTDEERQRIKAYDDALEEALSEVDSNDADAKFRVSVAVEQAHPLSQDIRLALSQEKSAPYADPLQEVARQINSRQFKQDSLWGLVVYRTAYGDDNTWKRMLDELQDTVDSLLDEPAPNPEIYPRHQFKIMDDQSQFESATIETLRDKFSAWVVDEYRANCKEEHCPSVEEFNADTTGREDGYFGGTRYNFFLVVDDICLESLGQACGAVVKLVQRAGHGGSTSLSAEEIEEMRPKAENSDWEGGVTESEFENVRWMYMETTDYAVFQEYLADPGNWEDEYLRPPQLRSADGFEDVPGSWRK